MLCRLFLCRVATSVRIIVDRKLHKLMWVGPRIAGFRHRSPHPGKFAVICSNLSQFRGIPGLFRAPHCLP